VGYNWNTGITHYHLTGFDSTGKPIWDSGTATPIPSGSAITSAKLGRILYLPATDQLILAEAATTSTGTVDWTGIGGIVEVYNAWSTNPSSPTQTIHLNTTYNPKTIAAAGNYLFVGYVHTVPNIDAFNLTTGNLDATLNNSDPSHVYVGNDVDSMYGVRAYLTSTGEYVVTKDNYNGSSIILYRWTPPATSTTAQKISFSSMPDTVYGAAPIPLQATASSGLPITYTVTGPATLNGQSLVITGAGTVTVTAKQAGDSRYAAATPVAQSFTVAPAVLTVTAQNLSMAYGSALPVLQSSVTGFVNGDAVNVVTGVAALSTAATSTSPVGAYTITAAQGSLAASNYSFNFVNGVLAIYGGRR
jgi:hypothetical protein